MAKICQHSANGTRLIWTRVEEYYLCNDCLVKLLYEIMQQSDSDAEDILFSLIESVITSKNIALPTLTKGI
jgi:hypothetical protein